MQVVGREYCLRAGINYPLLRGRLWSDEYIAVVKKMVGAINVNEITEPRKTSFLVGNLHFPNPTTILSKVNIKILLHHYFISLPLLFLIFLNILGNTIAHSNSAYNGEIKCSNIRIFIFGWLLETLPEPTDATVLFNT
jgi:hypothetical protein